MKPTLGRIVHLHTGPERAPLAAIVTAVAVQEITLSAFTPEGGRFAVTLPDEPGTEGAKAGYTWQWPPRE